MTLNDLIGKYPGWGSPLYLFLEVWKKWGAKSDFHTTFLYQASCLDDQNKLSELLRQVYRCIFEGCLLL